MKKLFISIALYLFSSLFCTAQDITPAPADKAVVYFVRPSSFGFAINFSYFDSARLIGKFNGTGYIRYECDPGAHLFWARSENKDFVEADLEAGKIYFIEAVPQMGGIKAGVQLVAVDPSKQKKIDKIIKLLHKKPAESFTPEELKAEQKKMEDIIRRGLEKYAQEKKAGNLFERLERTMYYGGQ